MAEILVKRVYDPVIDNEGFRVLVDRLWPRGLSKDRAAIDLWLKEIAPSDPLRQWYQHDPAKWDEFKRKYFQELNNNRDAVASLRAVISEHSSIVLLFASRELELNNAHALHKYILNEF